MDSKAGKDNLYLDSALPYFNAKSPNFRAELTGTLDGLDSMLGAPNPLKTLQTILSQTSLASQAVYRATKDEAVRAELMERINRTRCVAIFQLLSNQDSYTGLEIVRETLPETGEDNLVLRIPVPNKKPYTVRMPISTLKKHLNDRPTFDTSLAQVQVSHQKTAHSRKFRGKK